MLTENTGTNILDSGSDDGRGWQKNGKKTLADFRAEPEVVFDDDTIAGIAEGRYVKSDELLAAVSLFHYMADNLELDDICNAFNRLPVADWDSEKAYGLSTRGEAFFANAGLEIGKPWNSYNGESTLSQILQGANVSPAGDSNFEWPKYLLLQVHNGADARGRYTDAKLFKVSDDCDYFTVNPDVNATIDGRDVTTAYDGYSLVDFETGEPVPVKKNSKINLYL